MKRPVVAGAAILGLALGAFAQGSINVGNTILNPYICLWDAANHYNGPYTLQIWELNGSTIPAPLVGVDGSFWHNGTGLYYQLVSSGFTLEKTYKGTMSDGMFALGQLNMPNVSPAGSDVILALVVWNSSTTAWGQGAEQGGMAVFKNPTTDYTIAPPNTPTPAFLTGWDALGQNLVMGIPEPSVATLAALGMAALVVFRRKGVRR